MLASGAITVDIGVGRRVRALGPVVWDIAAPREMVFDVITTPYLGRTPLALQGKLRELQWLRPRLARDQAALADDYCKVIQTYLQSRDQTSLLPAPARCREMVGAASRAFPRA